MPHFDDTADSSLDETLPDGSACRFDRIGTESTEETSVKRLALNDALDQLSPREKLIVRLRYRDERSQAEVGRMLGVSQVQISRLEKKILLRLRSRMQD